MLRAPTETIMPDTPTLTLEQGGANPPGANEQRAIRQGIGVETAYRSLVQGNPTVENQPPTQLGQWCRVATSNPAVFVWWQWNGVAWVNVRTDGASGASVWGGIAGDISDQTDLVAALKSPILITSAPDTWPTGAAGQLLVYTPAEVRRLTLSGPYDVRAPETAATLTLNQGSAIPASDYGWKLIHTGGTLWSTFPTILGALQGFGGSSMAAQAGNIYDMEATSSLQSYFDSGAVTLGFDVAFSADCVVVVPGPAFRFYASSTSLSDGVFTVVPIWAHDIAYSIGNKVRLSNDPEGAIYVATATPTVGVAPDVSADWADTGVDVISMSELPEAVPSVSVSSAPYTAPESYWIQPVGNSWAQLAGPPAAADLTGSALASGVTSAPGLLLPVSQLTGTELPSSVTIPAANVTGSALPASITSAPGLSLGGDRITLGSSEIAISTTATATISRAHVCTGTTTDYTVTLPAASGNAGKMISIRISPACTKYITIKGNGSELIDGVNTRILFAKESCDLVCDGTSWYKVGGHSIAVIGTLRTASYYVTNSSWNTVQTATKDHDSANWTNTSTYRMTAFRPGNYRLKMQAYMSTSAYTRLIAGFAKNGTVAQASEYAQVTGIQNLHHDSVFALVATDYVQMQVFQTSGGSREILHGVWTGEELNPW